MIEVFMLVATPTIPTKCRAYQVKTVATWNRLKGHPATLMRLI